MILLERADHVQAGYIFAKGQYQKLRAAGLDALKRSIIELEPRLERHLDSVASWRDMTLLSVESSRCPKWYKDGLLLMGDADHVMTPVGGVGINLAVHDAVETANILAKPLKTSQLATDHLREVQRRRQGPTRRMQPFQAFVQTQLIQRCLRSTGPLEISPLVRLLFRIPVIRDIPARIIAFGFGRSKAKK